MQKSDVLELLGWRKVMMLNNAKANSINIMNALLGLIPDSQFGVISHMDYDGDHGGCGYGPTQYGDFANNGDYPYSMDQSITSNTANVAAAINGLVLGYGADGPESYTRALYETYADPTLGWRAGARRFVVAWGDNIPHDCNYLLDCGGGPVTTGPDPGRNGIDGDGDDLDLATVLAGMATDDITLIALHSGGLLALWDCYAGKTGRPGGGAFQINADGTVPGGTDIADFIADLVQTQIGHIDNLTLEVCTPGYEDWLVSVSPASYTDIDLNVIQDFEFDIEICVPEDAEPGLYCFEVCAVGDGAEYASQRVCITVKSEIEEVPLD